MSRITAPLHRLRLKGRPNMHPLKQHACQNPVGIRMLSTTAANEASELSHSSTASYGDPNVLMPTPFVKSHPPSDPMGITGQVSNWVDTIRLEDLPEEIKTNAKHLILDGIGCALIGAQLPWSKTAVKGVLGMEGPGNCTLFGWNQRVGPLSAALLNSTFIQGFELDDVHAEAPWHANSVVLPALFAAAEHATRGPISASKVDGNSFLLSTIVGFEIGSRVGHALHGSDMLSRGWHSGAVFGPPAAAAATAKLLRLNPEQIEDAMRTACTQACGLASARYESMGKRMQHGFAARNGLFSTLMAQQHYTGIDKIFDRPKASGGFLGTFGQGSSHDPPYLKTRITDNLGDSWQGMHGMRVKPYASLVATHAPVDCIASLQSKYPTQMEDLSSISKVTIEQSKAPSTHGGQEVERPLNALGAQMSTRYVAAVQLVDRLVLMDQFNAANLDRDVLWRTVDKIDCVWNREFDEKSAWHTRVTIEFEDSDRKPLVHEVNGPRTYDAALSNEDIRTKWGLLADSVVSKQRKEMIEEYVLGMEDVRDVQDIVRLLETEVKNPIA